MRPDSHDSSIGFPRARSLAIDERVSGGSFRQNEMTNSLYPSGIGRPAADANPAFGTFLNAKEVLGMAGDASRMPAREAEFRNLILNQRVEASAPFITPTM